MRKAEPQSRTGLGSCALVMLALCVVILAMPQLHARVTPRQSNTIGLNKAAHIIGRNTPDGRLGSLERAQILPVEEAGVL